MTKKVPRRMKRFYRQNQSPPEEYENKFNEPKHFEETSSHLPSMDYEDVNIDEKNFQELKKIEQMNLEEKLALLEVKKFKEEKKRLPNKDESNKMADNLYNQFKNQPMDMDEGLPDLDEPKSRRSRRTRGRNRHSNKQDHESFEPPIQEPNMPSAAVQTNSDIKDLFSDTPKTGKGKSKDPFDLDFSLDDDPSKDGDSLDELKSISGNNCPNCDKDHEKTIFCSSCGTEFCENCAKSHDAQGYVCPNCGKKSKA